MVEFREVSYRISTRDILVGVNFQVFAGQRLVLLGRSGSGKTTALRMVNAMLYPSTGDVLVEGRSTAAWDVIKLRRSAGYAIQDVGLFPHWTVARNIGLGLRLAEHPQEEVRRTTDNLLDSIGLPPDVYRGRFPRELSGGQRQRVGVARALAPNPRLLLMDEPFGAVDPVTRFELQNLLLQLCAKQECTMLFVTHDLVEALTVGTHIVLLDQGKVAWYGPASDFSNAQHPEARAFLACLKS